MRRIIIGCALTAACGLVLGAAEPIKEPMQSTGTAVPAGLAQAFENARLDVEPDGPGYRATNPNQKLGLRFDEGSASVRTADADVRLRLSQWGRAGKMKDPAPAVMSAHGNRIEYQRGPVTEWYVNDRQGLEQGFTLASRPEGEGPVIVALSVEGGLTPRLESAKSLVLDRDGAATLRYSELKAWDATGRLLESRMEVEGRGVRLVVNDGEARYPVTIDPYLQHAKLVAHDGAGDDQFGFAVAMSGDTALISSWGDDDNGLTSGSAYVFVRRGSAWMQQAKLFPSDAASNDQFGVGVALNGDTAVIGAFAKSGDSGAAYVFVRSGSTWTQQAKLVPSDSAPGDQFGFLVAVSGNTAIIGGGVSNDNVYAFVRNGITWTEQAKFTIPSDSDPIDSEFSVAVSGDTALIGVGGDNEKGTNSGAVYVFVRSDGTWRLQAKLTGSDTAAGDYFGFSASLSGDTAVVGAAYVDYDNDRDAGAVYVFVRNGSTWTEQAKLVSSDHPPFGLFGKNVAVSGNAAVIGTPTVFDTFEGGAAYVFQRNGTNWREQAKLTVLDGEVDDLYGDYYGNSVALSGNTAVVGAPYANVADGNSGAAYVYTLPITCSLALEASYANQTLTLTYTLSNTVPGAFTGWVVSNEGVRQVWTRPLGIIDPPQTGSVSIPVGPPPGGGASIIGVITQNGKAACVDIVGVGPDAALSREDVRRIAAENGISLP